MNWVDGYSGALMLSLFEAESSNWSSDLNFLGILLLEFEVGFCVLA